MGTKSTPGQFESYQKPADDEPLFVLLGRDRHAPLLVASVLFCAAERARTPR
jgi:hypothetical protein